MITQKENGRDERRVFRKGTYSPLTMGTFMLFPCENDTDYTAAPFKFGLDIMKYTNVIFMLLSMLLFPNTAVSMDNIKNEIVHMWEAKKPDPNLYASGFERINNLNEVLIFKASEATGGYNHHPQIVQFKNMFFAMWSNHRYGEDLPGQRVLYSTSYNAINWSKPRELFESLSPEETRKYSKVDNNPQYIISSDKWIIENDKLYARVLLGKLIRKKNDHYKKYYGYGYIYREVDINSIGKLFFTKKIKKEDFISEPLNISLPIKDFFEKEKVTYDFYKYKDINLSETTHYKTKNGDYIALSRDENYSHRMFVSYSKDGVNWEKPKPTDIPDSPSKSINLTLPNGYILLIGNQMAPHFDNPSHAHYNRDPLMVSVSYNGYIFSKAYVIKAGQQKYTVPESKVYGRGGGAQYPSAILVNNRIYVIYSMGKEDIWVSSFHLNDIGIILKTPTK